MLVAISMALHKNDESSLMQSRIRRVLESWDTDFISGVHIGGGPSVRQGPDSKISSKGAWNVVYCSTDIGNDHDGEFISWKTFVSWMAPQSRYLYVV